MCRKEAKPISEERLRKMHVNCLEDFMQFAETKGLRASDFITGMHHTYMTSPDRIRIGRVLIRRASYNERDLLANIEVVFDGVTYVEIFEHRKRKSIWDESSWRISRIGLDCEKWGTACIT